MTHKLSISALALLSTAMVSPLALAQDAVPQIPPELNQPVVFNEISVGVQYSGGHNTGQYGRYNGFNAKGVDILLGFDMERRDAWNSGGTHYFEFSGRNLDFQTQNTVATGFRDKAFENNTMSNFGPEAEISLAFGNQGSWGITADYDATTYTGNIISSLWTTSGALGTLNNGLLPYGGAPGPLTKGTTTAFTTTTLGPNFRQFQTGTRRDKVDIGGKYQLDEWTFATNIQHEHKQGSLEESLRETYAGMAFTLPVDFDTDRFDLSASYIDPDFQALIQYTYSHFADNYSGITLPYPVSISALSASSGPYAQAGLYATPPSNSAHYITAMLSDKLAPQTRLVFNGRIGVELQDSTFMANSADPGLSNTLGNPTYSWFKNLNSLNQGTSATSPNARAYIYQGNLTFSTELAEHLTGRASYSLDGRDVHINQYQVWIGGSSPDATANTAVYVVPQGWVKQNGSVELDYLVLPESSTKVTASYNFNNTNRTNAQVRHSVTHSFGLNVSSMLGKEILARVSYAHDNRSGVLHYGTAWGNLEQGVPEEDGTPSGAYYQAPMTADAVTIRADYAPESDLSGGVFAKFSNNRYHYPSVASAATSTNSGDWTVVGHGEGITHNSSLTIGPDVNYRPSNAVTLHAYYSYERIYFDNRGNGNCAENVTGLCAGSIGYYQNNYTSSMHTAGFSGDWKATDKLKFTSEYNLSVGSVLFGQFNGVTVPTVTQSYQNVTSYPDVNSRMDDITVTAIYQLSDNVEASLMYRYSMFNNNDWQYVAAPVIATTNTGTAISIVNAGYGAPNYNVSTAGMMLKVRL